MSYLYRQSFENAKLTGESANATEEEKEKTPFTRPLIGAAVGSHFGNVVFACTSYGNHKGVSS